MEQNPIDGMHAAQMEQIPMDCHLQNEPRMFILLTYCLLSLLLLFVFSIIKWVSRERLTFLFHACMPISHFFSFLFQSCLDGGTALQPATRAMFHGKRVSFTPGDIVSLALQPSEPFFPFHLRVFLQQYILQVVASLLLYFIVRFIQILPELSFKTIQGNCNL